MRIEAGLLDKPRRQHGAAVVLILLRLATQLFRSFWWVILLYVLGKNSSNDSGDSYLLYASLAFGAFSAVTSIVSYFRFYFYTQNGELVIERGVFQRNRLTVPFERIQTISFQQGPVHRLFNVVELEIDTAGSQGVEFNITALPRPEAERVRDYLIARRDEVRDERGETADTNTATVESTEADRLLLRLLPRDLLRVGVSQNHLRTGLLIVAFFFSIFQNIGEAVEESYGDAYNTAWETIRNSTWLLGLTFVVALLVVAFVLTLATTVLRYYDLRFWRTPTGFRLLAGLVNRREQSANLRKVQVIRWQTNPLRRYFGIWTLQLQQAGSVAATRKTSVAVPGCYAHHVTAVRRSYFPEEATTEFGSYEIHPAYEWRRTLYFGLVPGVLGLAVAIFVLHSVFWSVVFVALPPLRYLWARAYRRRFRYQLSPEGLRLKSGVIAETWQLLRWNKVQSVELKQGRYQRREALADVTLSTAAGKLRIPYIELHRARQLQDFVAYRVETARGSWM